jgi:hypothetical protein
MPPCNLLQQARISIVVGNSAPEVKSWAAGMQEAHQQMQQVHMHSEQQQQQACCSSPVVYAAKAAVAAGVLEGLQALGLLQQ